jgi:hypothetical protein
MIILHRYRSMLLLILMLILYTTTMGQNYIGMNKDDITQALQEDNPDFRLDNSTINNTYSYLKFIDDVSEQTVLFFLSETGTCTYVRWISDYANLNDIKKMLNSKYRNTGKDTWVYSENGKHFSVNLKEDEWYFTVNIFKD